MVTTALERSVAARSALEIIESFPLSALEVGVGLEVQNEASAEAPFVLEDGPATAAGRPRGRQFVRLRIGAGIRPPRRAKTAFETLETAWMGARPRSPP